MMIKYQTMYPVLLKEKIHQKKLHHFGKNTTKNNFNSKNKNNYRRIALATLLSKVLEKLILFYTIKQLNTTDNQSGFKRRSGCEQCIYTLKQLIDWCNRREIPLYVWMQVKRLIMSNFYSF